MKCLESIKWRVNIKKPQNDVKSNKYFKMVTNIQKNIGNGGGKVYDMAWNKKRLLKWPEKKIFQCTEIEWRFWNCRNFRRIWDGRKNTMKGDEKDY